MLGNGFVTSYGAVCEDLARISNGSKWADFEQKPWAIAQGFEHGRFWQVLELAPNSLKKRRPNAWKWISNFVRACSSRFDKNFQGAEIGRF